MHSFVLLALLAGSEYTIVQAASTQLSRRQNNTPVALWEPCNYPDKGINGPLTCAEGSECICKDYSYSQCRTQVDGSWTPPGSSWWQCQKPGDSPSGGLASSGSSTNSSASGPADSFSSLSSMNSPSTDSASTDSSATDSSSKDPSSNDSSSSSPDSSSSPGPSSSPGSSSSPASSAPPAASSSSASSSPPATGGDMVATGNQPGDGSKAVPKTVPGGRKKAAAQFAGASNNLGTSPTDGDVVTKQKLAVPAGGALKAAAGDVKAATVGDCSTVSPPAGFDGAASISYYGWMGSACQCGEAPWQWSGSQGFYHAAVNQKLFGGKLNGGGQPNCGTACGQCYELSTSGTNTYADGVPSGSTLTVQIVDACYSAGDHWCGSTADDYKDSSKCGVHFDIQTGPPGSAGIAPVGSDGNVWNGGGQIVYYTPVACPGSLQSQYQGCTCG